MKPRNKLEREVCSLSKSLRPMTAAALADVTRRCVPHKAYHTKTSAWCSECGYSWSLKDECELYVSCGMDVCCPNCLADLTYEYSHKRKVDELKSYEVVTRCGRWNVVRQYDVIYRARKGASSSVQDNLDVIEVVRQWVNDDGKRIVMARSMSMQQWCSSFSYDSDITIKADADSYKYNYRAQFKYGHELVTKKAKRNGYYCDCGMPTAQHIKMLLTDNRYETYVKVGQRDMARHLCHSGGAFTWHDQVMICTRHGYIISDATAWADMIRVLQELGKDTRNPKYICPKNLGEAHDYWLDKLTKKSKKEQREKELKEIARLEPAYATAKGAFLDLVFTGNNLTIRPLRSVAEFYAEGDAMRHCVYKLGYYKNDDSLILTARDGEGKRLATIEYNLAKMVIQQDRGPCNGVPERKKDIEKIINDNKGAIRAILATRKCG